MTKKFDHKKVEAKWVEDWSKSKLYSPELNDSKNKFYNLMMFPYPSAEGLHAGNMFAFTGSDVYGRFKRMSGMNVFQPIGLDGFGIHSENYAIKVKRSPQVHAEISEKNFYKQLHSIGNGFDWTKSLETYDPDYYAWTQWLFVEMFKAGLAYRASSEVNWCPSCKTVLADEQVIEGACERCGTQVTKKNLEQWFFKIKEYADRLLDNLSDISWPEKIKIAQTNWIGKKKGINISYKIKDTQKTIECWTSRPETNFGATFIVIAPENPLVDLLTTSDNKESVVRYIKNVLNTKKEDQDKKPQKKTGVFTGSCAINSLNDEELPIWVSDYAIAGVGTGAVVGVPGHDKRDFEFAKTFGLPIKRVVVGTDGKTDDIDNIQSVVEAEGAIVNSGFLNKLTTGQGYTKVIGHLEKKGVGTTETHYHLRNWLISRQRYWGPPIPMIFCEHCKEVGDSWFTTSAGKNTKGLSKSGSKQSMVESAGWYPEENLPVLLPKIEDYLPKGTGRGPLEDHPEFYKVRCPKCGNDAKRETDVADTFLDSSWYFLRYPSVGSNQAQKLPFDPSITKNWLPVDLYFGGAEHAVLHLMYARFVTMVLHDLKLISFDEPFPRFYAHGLVIKDGAKMSKSKGNVVNPDEYITKFGADTLRMYLMFMGPMDGYPDFRDTGIEGMRRFLERVWSIYMNYKNISLDKESASKVSIKMHQTIKKVTNDIENFRYNTAISAVMEYVNTLRELGPKAKKSNEVSTEWSHALEVLPQLIAPFAPFISEEIWTEILGKSGSIHKSNWPKFNTKYAGVTSVSLAVQINGKLKGVVELTIEAGSDQNQARDAAKSIKTVAETLKAHTIKKEIFVAGRILNFVLN